MLGFTGYIRVREAIMIFRYKNCVGLFFLFFIYGSNASTYKCEELDGFVAKSLCTNSDFADMETESNSLFEKLYSDNRDLKLLEKVEKIWIENRDKCDSPYSNQMAKGMCLKDAYSLRLSNLKNMLSNNSSVCKSYAKNSLFIHRPSPVVDNNNIYLTSYDTKNDNYDLIRVSPESYSFETLLTTDHSSSKYLTGNNEYLIYTGLGTAYTTKLSIFKIGEDKVVATKKFSDRIIFGKLIDNKTLLIVQKKEIFLIDLISLKVVKRGKFQMDKYTYGNPYSQYILSASMWDGKVILQTHSELLIYSLALVEVARMTLPEWSTNRMLISKDNAVVLSEENIRVIDLKKRETIVSIKAIPETNSYSNFTVKGDYLLLSPKDGKGKNYKLHVYNITNGELIQTLPFEASHIVHSGDNVIFLENIDLRRSTLTFCEINIDKT